MTRTLGVFKVLITYTRPVVEHSVSEEICCVHFRKDSGKTLRSKVSQIAISMLIDGFV